MHRCGLLSVCAVAIACGPTKSTDDSIRELHIDDPDAHYAEHYVELVPPIHLPSNQRSLDQVSIYVQLPDGAEIDVVDGPQGPTLVWPPGTRMERVEWVDSGEARSLTDVRGARIDEAGRVWHHTLRRTETVPGASLVGYEWPADDAVAHARATERLVNTMSSHPPAVEMSDERSLRYLDGIRRKNQCVRCHLPLRPENTRPQEYGLVHRGTDAATFFTPATLLAAEAPLESYGVFDRNLEDAHVTVRCSAGGTPEIRQRKKTGAKRARCSEGIARGHLDLAAAKAAGDPRAQRICDGRSYLLGHLSAEDRQRFPDVLRDCNGH